MKTGKMLLLCQFLALFPFISPAQEIERDEMLKKSFPDTPGNFVSFFDAADKAYFTITGSFDKDFEKPKIIHMWDYGLLTEEMTTITVSDLGEFDVTIPIYYTHEISLSINNKMFVLIANPENKIHMEFDENGVSFYGDGALDAGINHQYYEEVRTKFKSNKPYNRDDLTILDPLEYREIVEQRYSNWKEDLNAFFDRAETQSFQISPFIRRNRLLEVELDYIGQINSFEPSRKYRNKEKIKLKPVPDNFYEDLTVKNMQLEEDDYTYEDFESLLSESLITRYLDQIKIKINKTKVVKKILSMAKPEVSPLEYDWIFGYFYGYRGEIKFDDEMILDFVSDSETEWLKREIQTIQNGKELQDNVILSYGIDTTDVSAMEFDELMNLVTTKHQGKTIYLDIWGTWCTNCITQFSFSKQLHDAVEKDKVAFVYFAVRSDKNLWLNRIEKSDLAGDHYFLSDKQYQKLTKKWESPGLPQYIIINPDGQVKDYNAPRPSNNYQDLNLELVGALTASSE